MNATATAALLIEGRDHQGEPEGLIFFAGLTAEQYIPVVNWSSASPDASCAHCHEDIPDECNCIQCPDCGNITTVVAETSGPGFCAGTVYVLDLACGYQITDDQSYLED